MQPKRQPKRRRTRGGINGTQSGYGQSQSGLSGDGGLARAYSKRAYGGINARETLRVVEREFIQTVNGSVGFAVTPFVLNPGNVTTFPWLSIEAAGWESYRFNKLRFCYCSRKGSSTDGSVIMATDYDPADAVPVDEATMTTYQGCVEDVIWKELCMPCDSDQLNKIGPKKFIRAATVPTGQSVALYDSGNFQIATTGCADTSAIGKLWVEYDVTFSTKQKTAGTVAPTNLTVARFQSAGNEPGVSTVALQLAFSSGQVNGIGAVNTAGSVVLPAGNYLLDTAVEGLAGTDMTNFQITLKKNGAQFGGPGPKQFAAAAGALVTFAELSDTNFVTSNGTDAFTVEANMTATGAVSFFGTLRFVAV